MAIVLLLFSCEDTKKVEITSVLKGEKINIEHNFVGKVILDVQDSILLMYHAKNDTLVGVYFLEDNRVSKPKKIIGKGSGPSDMIGTFYASSPNYLSFCDFYQNAKMLRLHKDSLRNYSGLESIKLSMEMGVFPTFYTNTYIWLNDDTFMYIGGDFNEKNILTVVDIAKQRNFPCSMWFNDDYKGENVVKQGAYVINARIYKHPSKPVYIYTCGNGQYLETFSLNSEYKVENRRVILKKKPVYENTPDGLNYKIKERDMYNPQGVKFVIPTEKYLYIMLNNPIHNEKGEKIDYKGYSFFHNDVFQVFDWEGNHIKNIQLELPCYNMGWDAKNSILYTLTEEESYDVLMRYNLE